MDQFRRSGLYTFGMASAPAILDPDVAAIGPAELAERIEERRGVGLTFSIGLRVVRHQHADPPRLLRARRERPGRRRAAEKRDEIAAPHSITSSARASKIGGTSMPSALAVLRLMTSSNLLASSLSS